MNTDQFWLGFTKAAEESPEVHYVRRSLVGNPLSSAIEAREGKKVDSFSKAMGHGVIEALKGMGIGAALGAGLGAGASLASKGKVNPLVGAAGGGYAGGALGMLAGGLKGRFGGEASRIHGEHSKHKKD